MSALSEVSILFGQRAGDLEKAREIFTAETRSFVSGILGGIHRARSDPWINVRVRIDIPREIETETKTGYLSSQFAVARPELRFKKGTNFTAIADLRFGVEFDQAADAFVWQISLVPSSRYQRVDDVVWRAWRTSSTCAQVPGSVRQEKANTVRFVVRSLDASLTPQIAFNDVKQILEFLLTTAAGLGEAVGLDPVDDADA